MPTKNKLSFYRKIAMFCIIGAVFFFLVVLGLSFVTGRNGTTIVNLNPLINNTPAPSGFIPTGSAIPVDYSKTKVSSDTKPNEAPAVRIEKEYELLNLPTNKANETTYKKDLGNGKAQYISVTVQQNPDLVNFKQYFENYMKNTGFEIRYQEYFKYGNVYGIRAITFNKDSTKIIVYNVAADNDMFDIIRVSRDVTPEDNTDDVARNLLEDSKKFLASYPFPAIVNNNPDTADPETLALQSKNEEIYAQNANSGR